jgi:hypothetical protein
MFSIVLPPKAIERQNVLSKVLFALFYPEVKQVDYTRWFPSWQGKAIFMP